MDRVSLVEQEVVVGVVGVHLLGAHSASFVAGPLLLSGMAVVGEGGSVLQGNGGIRGRLRDGGGLAVHTTGGGLFLHRHVADRRHLLLVVVEVDGEDAVRLGAAGARIVPAIAAILRVSLTGAGAGAEGAERAGAGAGAEDGDKAS